MVCPDPGDTTWLLVSSVLVLGMMPGLGLFEAGLLRRRSALSIITQVFGGLAVMNMMWFGAGFSLVYGGDLGGVIGDLRYGGFRGLTNQCVASIAPSIPVLVFAIFQAMFAAITPLVMTGAFAERVRIGGFLVLIMVWEVAVYYPTAHAIWGEGFLGKMGVLDFAGGIVIHTSAGVGSVCAAVMMGHRPGFHKYHGEFPPHNVPLAAVGLALLFTGWIGFNAGSALASGFLAVHACANTMMAASASALTWGVISLIKFRRRIDPIFLLNGTLVGLAGITPASGYIEVWAAVVLGFILGITSYGSMVLLKGKLHIDDALDVGSIHGVPGVVGSLAIGVFATKAVNPTGVDGLLYGGGLLQLWFQLVGVVIVGAWAALVTLPLVFLLRRFEWFSLQLSDEAIGLDGKDHELNAYRELEEFVVVERPTAVAVPSTVAAASTTSSRTTPLLHAVQEL